MWDAGVVLDQMVTCIKAPKLPSQVVVGTDAKFLILALKNLPVWLQDFIVKKFVWSDDIKPAGMAATNK